MTAVPKEDRPLVKVSTADLLPGDIFEAGRIVVVSVEPIDDDPVNLMLSCSDEGITVGLPTKADQLHLVRRAGARPAYGSLNPKLKTIVDALLAQEFRVFVSQREARETGQIIETAQVCLDMEGPFAEVDTWYLLDYAPMLAAPIEAVSAYGYVGRENITFHDTLEGVLDVLRGICLSDTVKLRCHNVTVPNYGKKVLEFSGDYPEGFVEICIDGQERPVKL